MLIRNAVCAICASVMLCAFPDQSEDLQQYPGLVRVRALIDWHSLQDRKDAVLAVWMKSGGEECRKAMLDQGVKGEAAREICAVPNPRRGTTAVPAKPVAPAAVPSPVPAPAPKPAPQAPDALTNESVTKMVKAGLGDDVVVAVIQARPGKYELGPDELIALKRAGVSDQVLAAMLSRGTASAPVATPVATPAPPASPKGAALVLHDSTPVRLRLSRNLSSAEAKTGESVDFEVLDDLVVDGLLLVNRGSSAIGTVTDAKAKGRMAKGGKLSVNIDYVRLIDGSRVALRAVKDTKGGGHTGAMTGGMVATAVVFFPAAPLFLFMHGKDTVIPKGTEITSYVNGEITLDRSHFVGR